MILFLPHTNIHLLFDFQGSGSVENRIFCLMAKSSHLANISFIAHLLGARSRMLSAKPTAPMYSPLSYHPTPRALCFRRGSSKNTKNNAGLSTDPWGVPIPFKIGNIPDLKLTHAYCSWYTTASVPITIGGKFLSSSFWKSTSNLQVSNNLVKSRRVRIWLEPFLRKWFVTLSPASYSE